MVLSLGKTRGDIARYIIVGVIFILGCILTRNLGKEILLVYLGLSILSTITIKLSRKLAIVLDIIFPIYSVCVGIYIDHFLSIYDHAFYQVFGKKSVIKFILAQGIRSIVVEVLVIVTLYAFLRATTLSPKIAAIVSIIPTLLLSLANYFVYTFKGNELTPADLSGMETAFNVAGNYNFPLFIPTVIVVLPITLFVISLTRFSVEDKISKKWKIITSIVFGVATILLAISTVFCVQIIGKKTKAMLWADNGSAQNGYITNFALLITELHVEKPANYNKADFADITSNDTIPTDSDVNIIVIMNESYCDFSIYPGVVSSYEEPAPYWHDLTHQDNVRAGYAFSSVYGGNTANSEFEMLTGITMAGLPDGSIPYSMYIHYSIYSLPEYLNELGYTSYAMHPYLADGWNRPAVYPRLGFDTTMFIDDFEYSDDDIVRGASTLNSDYGFISDECSYNNLLSVIDDNKYGSPEFYFFTTIQNHGGYEVDNERLEISEYATGSVDDPQLNVYLSNVHRSDLALQMLLENLESRDEKFLVLIFGDHQPSLEVLEATPNELRPGGLKWMVPYIIWTNYDMPENFAGPYYYTSINYFSIDILNAAGIPFSPYFSYINEIRDNIPLINSVGYFSNETGSWHELTDTENRDSEANYLNRYYAIQYYSLFDS